ncbi:MAG: hypothetical protein ACO3VH_07155 [Ilumatobacteraceae bacterium]
MPTHFDITSIARRLDAGTYRPRLTVPAVTTATTTRPMRAYALEVLASGVLGGIIGFMLGGGLS